MMTKNNFLKKTRLLFFLVLIAVAIGSSVLVATAGTNLYSFSNAGTEGHNPYGALTYVVGTDTFYGMTSEGGVNDVGELFSFKNGLYTTLYSFDTAFGTRPHGSLTYVDSENKLYGMTSAGGANGCGVIFSYDLNVENPTPYTVMHSFDASVETGGCTPYGSLTYDAGQGLLYGMTSLGGEANFGTLFSIDLAGATYTRLLSLTTPELELSNMGKYPLDSLVSTGSYLIGMASEGGQFGYGVLFRSTFNGRYDKLYDFDGSSSGTPRGSLILGPGGLYYGMTESPATIFSFDPELDTFTSLYTFDSGMHPYGSLVFDGRNRIYGRADDGAEGLLFSLDGIGHIHITEDFTDTSISGVPPFGSLIYIESTNELYGMAYEGGANGSGVVYRTSAPSYPDTLSFTNQTDVDTGTPITSNTITMSGIHSLARASITECTSVCSYTLNGSSDTEVPQNVANGDTLSLTVNSGGDCGTSEHGTLDIGGVAASFTVSTSGCGGGGGDSTAPIVTFSMPSTGSSLTVALTYSATDGVGVTGYKVTETSTPPSAGGSWENQPITQYVFSSYGTKTLYAWAKDAAGNVSVENSRTIVLTENISPPPPPPSLPPSGGGGGASIKVITPVTIKEEPPIQAPVIKQPENSEPKEITQKNIFSNINIFDSPIKQQIRESFTPHQVEIIETSIRALIAGITTLGAAIVLASVLFLNPLAQPEFILIPIRLWALLLAALGIRKKPTPWGTVYDAITKQPIDPVRLSLVDLDGKEVASSITDSSGRFGFNVKNGIYKVVLKKTNYLFPSYIISRNNMRDEFYEEPYFGDYIQYDSKTPIQKNIPIDPIDFETEAWAKKNGDLSVNYSKRELIAGRVFNTMLLTTFLIVAISLIVYPEKYNVIVFILYIAAFVLRHQHDRTKHMGRLYDLYGKPLSSVVIKAYSSVNNTLIKTTKTNRNGQYYLHLPLGLYYIRVERKTTDGLYVPVYSSPELIVRSGTLNKVFNIAYSQ